MPIKVKLKKDAGKILRNFLIGLFIGLFISTQIFNRYLIKIFTEEKSVWAFVIWLLIIFVFSVFGILFIWFIYLVNLFFRMIKNEMKLIWRIFEMSLKDFGYWIYCEFVASFKNMFRKKYKENPEWHICQNVRVCLGLPPKIG